MPPTTKIKVIPLMWHSGPSSPKKSPKNQGKGDNLEFLARKMNMGIITMTPTTEEEDPTEQGSKTTEEEEIGLT